MSQKDFDPICFYSFSIGSLQFTTNERKGRVGTIQKFTVPGSTRYLIKAWGARGGTKSYNYGYKPGTYYGGKGAYIEGKFRLNKGTVLNIVVGQKGGESGSSATAGTGGGGGSFVYTTSNALLLAAGGGGGASAGFNGVDGQAGTSGTSSVGRYIADVRKGGTGGQPGECNTAGGNYHGGVGAGWIAQGCARAGSIHGERGGSRAQGWTGGRAGSSNGGYGGFGGGGGGSRGSGASGGGGGYSGGGSGITWYQAGGGGGSYCSGDSCSAVTGANVKNDGLVQIVIISE